jgi:GDP/UDP-N,N'-diacetylbacillosamine 2-epimerase (hydrolysing)
VLVLGDRSEIFAGVVAAMVTGVPVGHIHGGEITEGSIDENIRHAITKMAHLHFVAAEEYRARVIQLGEQPKRVYTVGALGIDGIKRLQLLDWQDLKTQLGIENYKKNVLVTFHPVTIEYGVSAKYLEEVLSALSELNDTQIIFSLPNSDAEGRMLQRKIKEFAEFRKNVKTFASLGQLRYLSCLKFVDCVIGNSSSGLIEAPTLKTATINIGDRQFGRLKADSVLDCKPQKDEILAAVRSVYTPKVRHLLRDVKNPYGEGCASNAIVKILERESLDGLLRKSFYDMPHIQSDF